ncbi:uncharacterized protein LOC124495445 isoform X1 [Dermatophagoides farinae]|uniref:uncharacterized protein LOC124495445 isoform X1 n=1 Tax=Dermatophagoides farinae TaxID=6954 RepID=UPI003F64144C
MLNLLNSVKEKYKEKLVNKPLALIFLAKMSKTLFCIQMSRIMIILLTLIFMILSQMQIFHITIIPWPSYHPTVAILLDLVLVIGLIASLIQHLKMLIFFSWLSALTFLLIFFGNTVSSQYQSDLIGMYYLLVICILSFTDAICIIKYRMPCEEAAHHHHHHHHSNPYYHSPHNNNPTLSSSLLMMTTNKCSQQQQQQLFDHQSAIADSSLLVPLPLPIAASSSTSTQHHLIHQQHHGTPPPPPPPPPQSSHHSTSGSNTHHHYHHHHQRTKSSSSNVASPSSPLPPPQQSSTSALNNNSHCYVPKNDPQFHAV